MSNTKLFISRDTQHRLISDIKDIMKSPLTDQGIYYAHDEDDMLKGYCFFSGTTSLSTTSLSSGFLAFGFALHPASIAFDAKMI